jgi:hypothetical protein
MAVTRKNNAAQMGGKVSGVGSYAEVYHGTKLRTPGGLHKKDLMRTRRGRIVSKRKHAAGLKALTRLRKMGFKTQKGKFVKFSKKSKKSMKKRGGSASGFSDAEKPAMMGGSASALEQPKL